MAKERRFGVHRNGKGLRLSDEQFNRWLSSTGSWQANTLVITALRRWANDDIKRRYLPRLASDTIGAYALSEAGSGSDAFAMTTRASVQDDCWVLTGRKLWVTNANEAELFIVFANAHPEAGYRGITAFVVERGFAGFSLGTK